MDFINTLISQLNNTKNNNSFCIDNEFYTYQDLRNNIAYICNEIKANKNFKTSNHIGVVCSDHLNTYASLIACWLCGCAYVPLGFHNPDERNKTILKDAKVAIILSTKKLDKNAYEEYSIIDTSDKIKQNILLGEYSKLSNDDLAYILYTSGSTGNPKGVPISFKNLDSFLNSFKKTPFKLLKTDKCLQMFELTFDVSISSYLPSLIAGACIYTVPNNGIKYMNVLKIINKYQLTAIQIVPSIIKLGLPLLNKLDFKSVKQCILTGEATSIDLLEKWIPVVKNANIFDFYGPTECTIYCTYYDCNQKTIKQYNGMLCIGQPLNGTEVRIVNTSFNEVKILEKGELLIYSPQLTEGYLNNKEKNLNTFINIENKRYYRSGDICYYDKDGDIHYCGRLDNQVKIQGFRVELNEIEFKVKSLTQLNNVALTITNKTGAIELVLIVEKNGNFEKNDIIENLKIVLPPYMIPNEIISMEELPINSSGKIDRVKIKEYTNEQLSL